MGDIEGRGQIQGTGYWEESLTSDFKFLSLGKPKGGCQCHSIRHTGEKVGRVVGFTVELAVGL